jgi:hypothetical protein
MKNWNGTKIPKNYDLVLKILHNDFDWKLNDSLTTTGKKLVADTLKANELINKITNK